MNSISDPHLNKRIKECCQCGCDVKVYGFDRCNKQLQDSDVTVIGVFPNTMGYARRIAIYLKGIRSLFKSHPVDDGIWYYQGLDVAMFATFFNPNKKYIYEECDLVHTNVKNAVLRRFLEWLDKRVIRCSLRTVMTSEGFLDYHYGKHVSRPNNVIVIPNKLSRDVERVKVCKRSQFDPSHIRFAFVGGLRYRALISIARMISRNFPNHEFHFYGFVSPVIPESDLPLGTNVFYHGAFRSPEDLSRVYSEVDLLVSTYDISSPNVRYAEPNKLYEAVYFRCPILVSRHTFLEKKVLRMGIGYSVDPFDEKDVLRVVNEIEKNYHRKQAALSQIMCEEAVSGNNMDLILNDIYENNNARVRDASGSY